MVLLTYVKIVAKVMAETPMPMPQCKSTCFNSHSFVDDIAKKCNEVDRGSEEGEQMEDNMNSCELRRKILHKVCSSHFFYHLCEVLIFLVFQKP